MNEVLLVASGAGPEGVVEGFGERVAEGFAAGRAIN
jgi:hypothetical protein